MISNEGSQRNDILNQKERKITGIVVTQRKTVGHRKINKEMKIKITVRKLMLRVILYKML